MLDNNALEEAMADYDMALVYKKNKRQEIYNNRGVVYSHAGRYQKGISEFSKAIALKPNYVPAYVNRIKGFVVLQQYQRALRDCETVLSIKPHHPWVNKIIPLLNKY